MSLTDLVDDIAVGGVQRPDMVTWLYAEPLRAEERMSAIENDIRRLAQARHVVVSQHAAGRIAKRNILIRDIVTGAASGEVIEDYPGYHAGPALLMLQHDSQGHPIHVVWGMENGTAQPAVIVTAYRPEPAKWSTDFRTRKP